jgi:hypothetical protein
LFEKLPSWTANIPVADVAGRTFTAAGAGFGLPDPAFDAATPGVFAAALDSSLAAAPGVEVTGLCSAVAVGARSAAFSTGREAEDDSADGDWFRSAADASCSGTGLLRLRSSTMVWVSSGF